MGSGSSTQNPPGGAGGSAAPPAGGPPVKSTAIASVPNQFKCTPVSGTPGTDGIGTVQSAEEFLGVRGSMPTPPHMSAAARATNALATQQQDGSTGASSAATAVVYRWFVEDLDRPGHWEAYNDESSRRLESAFLGGKDRCLITLRKCAYTVDLTQMQQMPQEGGSSAAQGGQRSRVVTRSQAKPIADPKSGDIVRYERIAMSITDPFADENEADEAGGRGGRSAAYAVDAAPSHTAAGSHHTEPEGTFPRLKTQVQASTQPIYAMALSPAASWLGAGAKAEGGLGGTDASGNAKVFALTGGKDGRLVEWDVTSGAVKTRYAITASQPSSVLVARYSPSGRFVVCGVDDTKARVYKTGTPAVVHMLSGHTHKVYGAAFLSNEEHCLTGSMDAHIREWSVETGKCIRDDHCHASHIFSVTASETNPNFAVSAGNDGILVAHDLRCENSAVMRLVGHTQTLWDSAIAPGEGGETVQLASAGMDKTVRLWDPRRPDQAVHVMELHDKPVHAIQYMPHGRGILSSGKDAYVYFTQTRTGEVMWRAKAQLSSVFRVVYHADRKVLMTCGVSGKANEWDWSTGGVW